MTRPSVLRATIELIFAGAAWGFGFVATAWALQELTPTEVLFWRFFLAAGVGFLIYYATAKNRTASVKESIPIPAVWGGVLLGFTLVFQTWGLKFTTATNSGFLTTLYVIEVPLIAAIWLKHKILKEHIFAIIIAIIGTGLMVEVQKIKINPGDLLTVLCSLFAALHIVYVGKVSQKIKNVFQFNNVQSATALLMMSFLYFPQANKSFSVGLLTISGLLFLGLIASLIAFALQVRSQQVLSPTVSSLLFLLESPFAAFFGFLFLAETINFSQLLGAILILIAGAVAIFAETKA